MTVKSKEDRIHLDPREWFARTGDLVQLSNYKFNWEVKHVSYDGSTLYLRSTLGGRPAQVLSNQITSIWRNPKGHVEIDNSQYYSDNYWEDVLEDWDEED